ncbi:MAG: secretin and TonB N-terminal domain-containing protein [Candidatus Omnitrophica bacterium]|nr:secretin and TonB N-terminal domain-containing protein [Candidatus Omnitrophota bacterium]MDD5488542.1 secretin and TonB N-terminal domain-containing protein [Candidatus Omnitrophota bacterium]
MTNKVYRGKMVAVGISLLLVLAEPLSLSAQDVLPADVMIPANIEMGNKALTEKQALKDIVVSIEYDDVDIGSIIKALSYTYNINFIETTKLSGKVSVSLQNVSLEEALKAILGTQGYTYSKEGDIYYIVEGGGIKDLGLQTELLLLHYLRASTALNFIEALSSTKGTMSISESTNGILITDFPDIIERAKDLIDKVDIPPVQVIIEAKLLDINKSDLESIGTAFTFDYSPIGIGKGIFNRKVSTEETFAGEFDNTATSDLPTGQFKITDLSIKGFEGTLQVNALLENKDTDVLASPSIATLNGLEAKILIGERYPYKETTQTTTGTTETTNFVDIGTVLAVTPYVSPGGYITMEVHPEVSTFLSALDDGSPRITTREATATIRVKDGQTIMLAGLMNRNDTKTVDKIPILGDIPLLGKLFSSKSTSFDQRELVIFLTPHIIPFEPAGREANYMGRKETFINLEGPGERALISATQKEADDLADGKGMMARDMGKTTRLGSAADRYAQIAQDFPDSQEAPYALKRAAEIYCFELKDYNSGLDMAVKLFEKYPTSPYVADAIAVIDECDKAIKEMELEQDVFAE